MLDEAILALLEPAIKKRVDEAIAERMDGLKNEAIDLNLAQASVLVGRGQNSLKEVFYRNRKEVEATKINKKGFVIFGEGNTWRIGKQEFVAWWTTNRYKTA